MLDFFKFSLFLSTREAKIIKINIFNLNIQYLMHFWRIFNEKFTDLIEKDIRKLKEYISQNLFLTNTFKIGNPPKYLLKNNIISS